MRKIYLLFLSLFMLPVIASAQSNQAITKTLRTNASTKTDSRCYVDPSILKPVVQGEAESYTLSAWVKISGYLSQTGAANKMVVMGYGGREHCNDNGCWNLCINKTGNIEITGWGTKGASGALSTTVSTGEWHYLTVVYDSSIPSMSIYLDGELAETKTMTAKHEWFTNETPALYFASYGFGGLLDEVHIYNKALSAEEVATAQIKAQNIDGLVGLYTFDETPETTGEFPNKSTQNCASSLPMSHENVTGQQAWDNGLAYVISAGSYEKKNPTLVESDRVISFDVDLTVPAADEITGGSIAVTANNTTLEAGTHTIQSTDPVVVTATPAEGYTLVGVYANGTEITAGTEVFFTEATTLSATFTAQTYALTVTNTEEIPYTLVKAIDGSAIDLTAIPAETAMRLTVNTPNSHILEGVTLDGTDLALAEGQNYYEITMPEADAALAINARAKASYTISFTNGAEGTIAVSHNGEAVEAGASVLEGETVTITATAAEGYVLTGLTVNGEAFTSGSTYTVNANVAIEATYRALEKYTVTFEQPANGTITVTANGSAITSGSEVYEGTVITVTAAPAAGYTLDGITLNGSALTSETYTVNENVVIAATFIEGVEYCIPTPVSGHLYESSQTTRRTDRGITSLRVTDGTNTVTVAGGTTAGRKVYVDATSTVLNSEPGKTVTVTVSGTGSWMNTFCYVDFDMNNFTTSDKVFGNYTGGDNSYAVTYSFTIPADVTGGDYRVRHKVDWDDQDPCVYGQSGKDNGEAVIDFIVRVPKQQLENPRTVSVVSANEALGTVAITSPATTESSISTDQANVVVKATPAEGAAFMNWTNEAGDIVSTDATYTYKEAEDVTLTANFGYVLTYTLQEGSSATFTAGETTYASGDVVAPNTEITVVVTPPAGKIAQLAINGTPTELTDNTCTFEMVEATEVAVTYVDRINHLTILVEGNGTVECWTYDDGNLPGGTQIMDGETIPHGTPICFYLMPGDGESVRTLTYQVGDEEAVPVSTNLEDGEIWEVDYKNALEFDMTEDQIINDIVVSVNFTGESQGIEEIGIDPANGPVEYYNLQGVRVAAENLAPGFYIIRQGSKAVKVFITK